MKGAFAKDLLGEGGDIHTFMRINTRHLHFNLNPCSFNKSHFIYRHERVDLTFFDAHSNGSHFDLGEIPLPVQTNVTGQILTGIAPISLGAIQNASDVLSTLPLTGTIINITHSDTSFINLSHRPSVTENGTILNAEDIAKIPGLNGTAAFIIEKRNSTGLDNSKDENTDEPKFRVNV